MYGKTPKRAFNAFALSGRAQLLQHAYPYKKPPLHHEGGGSYTILHGKTLNPKHITKQGRPNHNMKETKRTYL